MPASSTILRPSAEQLFADELAALAAADQGERPPGWKLSPRAVVTFICGSDDAPLTATAATAATGAKAAKTKKSVSAVVARKFHGDDRLVERCVVGLMGNRALLLIGEPGTAKSWLSELLAAAISGTSTNVVQGTAATTEDQVRYSWNYALLLAEGPTPRALVPSPIHVAMAGGSIARFEELTRCPAEVQDTLVSILSEQVMTVPELPGDERLLYARPGFNVIATANIRDRGVHEMSSALKRRFHVETVHPIADAAEEAALVRREAGRLLAAAKAPAELGADAVELLVAAFRDLRSGTTPEGIAVERPSAVMSTAEAVAVTMAAGLESWYLGAKRLAPAALGRHLPGCVCKDSAEDAAKLRHYLATVVAKRAGDGDARWKEFAGGVREAMR